MGTVFSFDVRGGTDSEQVRAALEESVALLHRTDETFSPYRPESQVTRLNRGELTLARCDPRVRQVWRLCAEAERESGGWFSARYARRPGGGCGFDPTGLVKGWAVEQAARLLALADAVCVNGGGDIQLRGGPWRIGISDPLEPGALAAVVGVADGARETAVATSGPAERGCLIVDPHTGEPPVTALASVTVVCPGLTRADARATAAYAMGDGAREWLEELPDTEGFAVALDGSRWYTSGFGRYATAVRA
ncbi:FAD:protein FMN transferase [Streptomyces sp. JJ36]|nr:FAD:protein FMN transferase [Streptomyces sp. JJ36]